MYQTDLTPSAPKPSLARAYWDQVLVEYLGDLRHDLVDRIVNVLLETAQSAPATVFPLLDTCHLNADQALHAIESLLSHSADAVSDRWELYAFHYVFAVPPHAPVPLSHLSHSNTNPPVLEIAHTERSASLMAEIRKKCMRINALNGLLSQIQSNTRNLELAIQQVQNESHTWMAISNSLKSAEIPSDLTSDTPVSLPDVQDLDSTCHNEHIAWYQQHIANVLNHGNTPQSTPDASCLPLVPTFSDLIWINNAHAKK